MARLEDLHQDIDAGKAAVIVLAMDHPLNKEGKNLKIFIKQKSSGIYTRNLVYVDDPSSIFPSSTYSWNALVGDEESIEAISDEWNLES